MKKIAEPIVKKSKKKRVKPAYIVDITNATSMEDVFYAAAKAKYEAGVILTNDDVTAIANHLIELFALEPEVIVIKPTKENFWTKIKNLFKRK